MSLFLNNGGGFDPMVLVIILVVVGLLAVMVLPMVANRKRGRAVLEMRDAIDKGDVIKTVSGVIGTVVDVEIVSPVDRIVVIETGLEGRKTTMRMDIAGVWGIISKAGAAGGSAGFDGEAPEPYGETRVLTQAQSEQALEAAASAVDPFAEAEAEAAEAEAVAGSAEAAPAAKPRTTAAKRTSASPKSKK